MKAGKALAAALKRLRGASGLSQAALAERANLSTQHVAALEQCRREPSLATLDALSNALGVGVPDLFVARGNGRRRGTPYPSEIAELVQAMAALDSNQRTRVLTILREACALAEDTSSP